MSEELERRLRAEADEWDKARGRAVRQGNTRVDSECCAARSLLREAADTLHRYREALERVRAGTTVHLESGLTELTHLHGRTAQDIARNALTRDSK